MNILSRFSNDKTFDEATILVYAIGSSVLVDEVTSARVVGVQITQGSILYQCIWWHQGTRNVEWLEDWEVRPDTETIRKQRIDPIL